MFNLTLLQDPVTIIVTFLVIIGYFSFMHYRQYKDYNAIWDIERRNQETIVEKLQKSSDKHRAATEMVKNLTKDLKLNQDLLKDYDKKQKALIAHEVQHATLLEQMKNKTLTESLDKSENTVQVCHNLIRDLGNAFKHNIREHNSGVITLSIRSIVDYLIARLNANHLVNLNRAKLDPDFVIADNQDVTNLELCIKECMEHVLSKTTLVDDLLTEIMGAVGFYLLERERYLLASGPTPAIRIDESMMDGSYCKELVRHIVCKYYEDKEKQETTLTAVSGFMTMITHGITAYFDKGAADTNINDHGFIVINMSTDKIEVGKLIIPASTLRSVKVDLG